MKTVRIEKKQLQEKLRSNMNQHLTQFEKAFEGYRKECISILEANLDTLKKGGRSIVQFMERPPEDHSDDYDRVIAMLDMSVDDVIELSNQEFAQYVQDDWSWKHSWAASNTKYISRD